MIELISVLLPVRNGEDYILESIQSVIDQTYSNFELVIVNDGSTDNTVKIIESFSDPRILILNTGGGGLVSALNHGLQYCKGNYVARMDADDVCIKNRFKNQLSVFKANPEIGVVFTNVELIDDYGASIGITNDRYVDNVSLIKALTYKKKAARLIHPSAMIRTDILKSVDGYRDYIFAEDVDLWLRLLVKTNFYIIPLVLLKYRVNSLGISRTKLIEQKVSSMMAVLSYEIRKENADIYTNNREFLKICEKHLLVYANKLEADFDRLTLLRSKLNIKKMSSIFVLFNKNTFHVIKYLIGRRVNDRKMIENLIKLFKV